MRPLGASPLPDLSAVIVAHNAAPDLERCVTSLRQAADGCDLEVVVVDSGSSDGSAGEAARLGAHLVSLANVGYGAGTNAGWRAAAGARYLLVINPDAAIVGGSLREVLESADREQRVGVFAPRLVDATGQDVASIAPFESSWRRLVDQVGGRSLASRYEPVEGHRTFDWAIGCALLVRGATFDAVGGFDERFFLYAEERDLLQSIRAAGWGSRTLPELVVEHESAGRSPAPALFAQRFRADLYYARKWEGRSGLLATRAALATDMIRRLARGQRDEWFPSYRAALRVVLGERVVRDPIRARKLQRARTIGSG